jgi:iron complex outermembrane recepter protein
MKGLMRLGIMGVFCLSAAVVVPLSGGVVFAADESKSESVFTLGEVEVTAKGEETKNVTIEKVRDEEMREYNRDTVGTALNLLPGVTLSMGGNKNEQAVFVRGLGPRRVPMFIDGVPTYVPYDGTTDMNRFLTFDFSEIILSKGFTSVLYGPNTLGGAINVISKRPEKVFESNGGLGFFTGGEQMYANFGTNQGKWYAQGGISYVNKDYFLLSEDYHPKLTPIRQGNSYVYRVTEDGGQRENSANEDTKYNIKFGLTPADGHEYALSYWAQNGSKGVPPYAGTDRNQTVRYWKFPVWDKEGLYFNSRTPIGPESYVKSRAYYDQYDNSIHSYDDATYSSISPRINSSFRSDYRDHTYGGSVEFGTTAIHNNLLKIAGHYKDDVHKERNQPNPFQEFEDRLYSIGAEDTITINKRLYAILGISYDKLDNVKAEDWNVASHPDYPDASADAWNPQAGLFYSVTDTGKLNLSISQKTRFPTMFERYSYRFGRAVPNPGLDPETGVNYELGYEDLLFKRVAIKTAVFYRDLSDFILSVTLPSGLTQNQNVGDVKQFGFEIEAYAPITSMLEVGFNYTYLDMDNETNNDKITDIPEHKLFFNAKFTPVRNLTFLGDLEYDSKRWSSTDGVRQAKGFTLVNAKVMYQLTKQIVIESGVKNLFDRNWTTDEGFPQYGRTVFGNVRYRF